MRGSIKQIGDGVWRLRYDVGVDADGRRKQKMESYQGTKKQAEQRLRDVLKGMDDQTYVEPRKLTLGQWLKEWMGTQKLVGKLRASTLRRYSDVIEDVIANDLSMVPLQKLTESHLERLYATFSPGQRHIVHTVVRRALRRAVKERLMASNPAAGMDNAPRRKRERLSEDAQINCWSAEEARKFLTVVKLEDPQTAALFAFLLDTGARKNEACGLLWKDVDLDAATVTIERQLLSPTVKEGRIQTGPTKSGQTRVLGINAETVRLLRAHRQHQNELRMANRTSYHDHGLVFAKTWGERFTRAQHLGDPLQSNNLGERVLDRLIEKVNRNCRAKGEAPIKRITVHGLRHTAATLQLLAKVPVHVVATRLGHSDVSITFSTYAHCLRDAHKAAAETLGRVLHG